MTHTSLRRNATLVALVAGIGLIAFSTRAMLRAETIFSTTAQAEQGLTVKAGKDTIFFCINKETIAPAFPLMDAALAADTGIRFSVEEYTGKATTGQAKKYVSGVSENSLTEFSRGKLYLVRTDRDLFFRCNEGLRIMVQAGTSPGITPFRPAAPAATTQTSSATPQAAPVTIPATTPVTLTQPTCPTPMCAQPVVPEGCQYVMGRTANGCPDCGTVVCPKTQAPLLPPASSPTAPSQPLELTLASPPGDYAKGSVIDMVLDVKNAGSTPLDSAQLSLAMPSGYRVPVEGTSGNCSGQGNTVSCQNFTLNAGQTQRFTFPFVIQNTAQCDTLEMIRVIATGRLQGGTVLPQAYSNFAAWSVSCDTPSSAQASSAVSIGTSSNAASSVQTTSSLPASSSSRASTTPGAPMTATLTGPNGLQKNMSATYTLVMKNTTNSTTLQNVSFTFSLPTGMTTEGQSTIPNCAITANSMSCSGLSFQPQHSMTLTLPVKTLNTLPCDTIPLNVRVNASGYIIMSNTIQIQGCTGGSSSSSVTVLTTINAPLGYLPKNTPHSLLATIAAFSTPFTDGTLRIAFPTGIETDTPGNGLNVGTCTANGNIVECTGISRSTNQGVGYTVPFTVTDYTPCGRGDYVLTFTYKDQGVEKQITKTQGMQLCVAAPVDNGPLDRFSIAAGTATCVSSDCRTVTLPVTLKNTAPIAATNTLIAVNLDTSWTAATLNGIACMIVDMPSARMFNCPGSPYLTIPAETTQTYSLVLTTNVQCPVGTARTAVLLQSAPASIYEEDRSNNSVYATIPAACTQGPVSSSSIRSSSSSVVSSSSSSSSAQPVSSASSSLTMANSTVLQSVRIIKVTPSIPYGDTVVVTFQKNNDICAHLKDANFQNGINQNAFCGRQSPITLFLSSMNPSFGPGKTYALCHGNNANDCSNAVTVTEEQSTVQNAGDLISIKQGVMGTSNNQCMDATCSRLLMPVGVSNKSPAEIQDVRISATVDASWSAATLMGLPCSLRNTTPLGGRRTFDCPEGQTQGLTVRGNSPNGLGVGLVLTRTTPCPVPNYQASVTLEFQPGTSFANAYPNNALYVQNPQPCQASSSSASSRSTSSEGPEQPVAWNTCNEFEKMKTSIPGPSNLAGDRAGWPWNISAWGIQENGKNLSFIPMAARLATYSPEFDRVSNKSVFDWKEWFYRSYYAAPVGQIAHVTKNGQPHAFYIAHNNLIDYNWNLFDLNLATMKVWPAAFTYDGAPQNPLQTSGESEWSSDMVTTTWHAGSKRLYYFAAKSSTAVGIGSQAGYFDLSGNTTVYRHIANGPAETPSASVVNADGSAVYILYRKITITQQPYSYTFVHSLYKLDTTTNMMTKIATFPSQVAGYNGSLTSGSQRPREMVLDEDHKTLYFFSTGQNALLEYNLETNTLSAGATLPADLTAFQPTWYTPQKGMYLFNLDKGDIWRYRKCP